MKLKFDISKDEYKIIAEILGKYLESNQKIYIFGSRAKNETKYNSDLDLAIEKIDRKKLIKIKNEFEESRLPYKVDILELNSVSEDFRKRVKKEMKEFPIKEKKKVPELRFKEFSCEWKEKKLGEVSYINPKSKEIPNIFKYIDLESVENGFLKQEVEIFKEEAPSRAKRTLENNDILYQTVRPYQKNNLFFNKVGNYVASTGYAQIRAKEDTVFLYQYLHNEKFVNSVLLRCTGTSYPAINSNDLSKIKIPLPSLPEQEKIANFLSSVDKRIEQLTKKVELLKKYKKGVMQKIFSGEIRFKNENGEDYPDWIYKKLGDITSIMQSGLSRLLNDDDIGLPVIRSNNLVNGFLDVSDLKYWYKNDNQGANTESYFLKDGDLLVNFINSLAQIGKIAIYTNILDREVIFTTNVMRLRFKECVNVYFIFNYFQTSKYYNYIHSITKPAVNQASFTKEDFNKFIIPLPSLPEQTKIANFLSSIDEQIEQTQKSLDKTKEWKKGLLQKMFV
jgi:type I restriction enzyme S subunit